MTTIVKRPTTVRISGGGSTVIRLDRSTVAAINNGRPALSVTQRANSTSLADRRPTVAVGSAMGVQGPQGDVGPPGASADGSIPAIAFSYGDASSIVWTPDVAGTLTVARLVLTTAFDGAGAALALGTVAAPGSILATTDNDPATTGEYEATADKHLDALEGVRFVITPGVGASQGAGLIYLTFLPD